MPHGTKVGLSPGDYMLDGDPVPLSTKGWSRLPNFEPISIVPKRLDASRCHLVWRQASAQATFVLDEFAVKCTLICFMNLGKNVGFNFSRYGANTIKVMR